ncbi:spondin-1-like isoform X1 [Montipora capricornis]|uniref:spondin-1-like isoform X1 n=1 Tax=Montipora capricornis TaxID=246305 RepID=UPI0035F13A77
MLAVKFLVFILLFVPHDTDGWRRRRRRRCQPTDCSVSSWNSWSSCSTDTCGQQGLQRRSRTVTSSASCGGAACPTLDETRQCYGSKQVDCQVSSWSQWSACTITCGVSGIQSSARHRIITEKCGGACPYTLQKTRRCQTIRCLNGGTQQEQSCFCKEGYAGDCCEKTLERRECHGVEPVDCQVKTRQCQEIGCLNGGTMRAQRCVCKEGFYGDCCERGNGNTHSGYIAWKISGGSIGGLALLIAFVCVIRCYCCPNWRIHPWQTVVA